MHVIIIECQFNFKISPNFELKMSKIVVNEAPFLYVFQRLRLFYFSALLFLKLVKQAILLAYACKK